MGKKKVVLDQFDFIRAIACLGIVLFHFAVEYGWPDIFNNYVGGVTYGDIYVTVFFFISGALLFYNHSEVDDLKLFYKKSEYSCAVTPQVRQTGNRLSGLAGTAYASLLT